MSYPPAMRIFGHSKADRATIVPSGVVALESLYQRTPFASADQLQAMRQGFEIRQAALDRLRRRRRSTGQSPSRPRDSTGWPGRAERRPPAVRRSRHRRRTSGTCAPAGCRYFRNQARCDLVLGVEDGHRRASWRRAAGTGRGPLWRHSTLRTCRSGPGGSASGSSAETTFGALRTCTNCSIWKLEISRTTRSRGGSGRGWSARAGRRCCR